MICVWQSMAKPVEQRAKIPEGLLAYGVRPGKEGELLPPDWTGALQYEISQPVLDARPVEANGGVVALKQAK
jgi:hypothetical protein